MLKVASVRQSCSRIASKFSLSFPPTQHVSWHHKSTFWDPRGSPQGPKPTRNAPKITTFTLFMLKVASMSPPCRKIASKTSLSFLPTQSNICDPNHFPLSKLTGFKKNGQNQLWRAIPQLDLHQIGSNVQCIESLLNFLSCWAAFHLNSSKGYYQKHQFLELWYFSHFHHLLLVFGLPPR